MSNNLSNADKTTKKGLELNLENGFNQSCVALNKILLSFFVQNILLDSNDKENTFKDLVWLNYKKYRL